MLVTSIAIETGLWIFFLRIYCIRDYKRLILYRNKIENKNKYRMQNKYKMHL